MKRLIRTVAVGLLILGAIAAAMMPLAIFGAAVPGVRVTDSIVPTDDADEYPTHLAEYGKGGLRTVPTYADLALIPLLRRETGMEVFVASEALKYRLDGSLTNWMIASPIQVASLGALGALPDSRIENGQVVAVLGHSTPGDWGELRWATLSKSATNAVHSGAVQSTMSGAGRWIFHDCIGGRPINVRWFGAFPNDGIEDTSAIQSALDFAAQANLTVELGTGVFEVNSIRISGAKLTGDTLIHEQGTAAGNYQPVAGSVLQHRIGATNHAVRIAAAARAGGIENVYISGYANLNLINPKTITATGTNRLQFFVAPGDTPNNGGTTTAWPYFGHCFFYASDNNYLGWGVVSNVIAETGEIRLLDNTDFYATESSNPNFYLTPGWKVVFSPAKTEVPETVSYTVVDPTSAGYAGISVESETAAQYEPLIENVVINKFHTGIRIGGQTGTRIRGAWCKFNNFAGIATAFHARSFDTQADNIYIQGFYNANYLTNSVSLTNIMNQFCGFGLYAVGRTASWQSPTIDRCTIGAFFLNDTDSMFPTFLVDSGCGHGVWLESSGYHPSQNVYFGNLTIRSHAWVSNAVPMPSVPGRRRYAVYGSNRFNKSQGPYAYIANLVVRDHSEGTTPQNRFDAVFHSDVGDHGIQVGHLMLQNGASNTYSLNTLGRFDGVPIGYAGRTMRPQKPDIQFDEVSFGLATNQARTVPNMDSQGRWIGYGYGGTNNPLAVLGYFSSAEANQIQFGGWGVSSYEPATKFEFRGADSKGGTEELWAQMDNSTAKWWVDEARFHSPFLRMYANAPTFYGYSSNQTSGTIFNFDGSTNVIWRVQDRGTTRVQLGASGDVDFSHAIRIGGIGSGPRIASGAGSPEGAQAAPVGSLWLRTDGGSGTAMYVKESGTGTTGWVPK